MSNRTKRKKTSPSTGRLASSMEREMQVVPEQSRPTVDFDDPVMCEIAWRNPGIGVSAYLMALAAWQRGLKVTFHYECATAPVVFNPPFQGAFGELFSVSDGRKTHYFFRSCGDRTTALAGTLATDKHKAKEKLADNGIDVPAGILVSMEDPSAVQPFLRHHPNATFVLKPNAASLGRGVQRSLSANEVLDRIARHSGGPLLLEEHVRGTEYRIYVAGNRYVAAYERRPANVEGDGVHDIEQLVALKNDERNHSGLYPDETVRLGVDEITFLQARSLSATSIPPLRERVFLSDAASTRQGADTIDATDRVPESARWAAIQACRALGLPNAGMDVIVNGETGRIVVLEANENAFLTHHAFPRVGPSPGNRAAEATIDLYFPGSVHRRRLTKANFDFTAIIAMLRNGSVAEIGLPVIGEDWQHVRLGIPAELVQETTRQEICTTMAKLGIHGQVLQNPAGDLLMDLVAPQKGLRELYHGLGQTLPE